MIDYLGTTIAVKVIEWEYWSLVLNNPRCGDDGDGCLETKEDAQDSRTPVAMTLLGQPNMAAYLDVSLVYGSR